MNCTMTAPPEKKTLTEQYKKKILLNYEYELYPITTAAYIEMAISRRDDLVLLRRDDLDVHRPDYIINIEPVPYIVKVEGVPSCYWEIDNHVIMANDEHWYKDVDVVILAQKYFLPFYEQWKTDYVPLGADPTVHFDYTDEPVVNDLVLIGNDTYPERRKLLNILSTKYKVKTGQANAGEEYSRALSSSKIVFNKSMNLDINMRVYEALACGRMLLTDRIPFLDELLEDGKHYVGYDNAEEMQRMAEYYLTHDEERNQIAKQGREHVILNHTYDQRLCQMINILDNLKSQ